MYLKHLQIVNYKNLKNVEFTFNKGANTIIGENDSGKSNALTALRILLDDSFYYNTKRLKESDFTESLGNWRGHWIIISACFDEITGEESNNEICRDIIPEKENEDFLKNYIRSEGHSYGTVTLFIRPQKAIRRRLFEAKDEDDFEDIRDKIRLTDYEFVYTSRSQMNFTDMDVYKSIVGDVEAGNYANPDEEDGMILGQKLNILEMWQHISVVFVDALRDVELELKKAKNPIRRIIDTIQAEILDEDINGIKEKIQDLNKTISNVKQISNIGSEINSKLSEIIGLVYSPNVLLKSQMKDDISILSKFLTMTPSDKRNLDLLGLGHLNILFIALKLVEFEFNKNRELVNLMIIEEPEAHIHTHIQKTLFDNLQVSRDYTQVIMTTHSTHLSEAADITRVNILKCKDEVTTVMQPSNGLDEFGKDKLASKNISLTKCLERYLDAKRSVLLFSKGVILVEGDGEEILIPSLVKKALGVSLDELGIGLINIGSVAFENLACIFDESRLQRYCAIVTDMDQQLAGASKCSEIAEARGKSRKEKLDDLFGNNSYICISYAPYTLEVDFANEEENRRYIKGVIDYHYRDEDTKIKHKDNLDSTAGERYDSVLTVAKGMGKGWYATVLAEYLDSLVVIPEYILKAIAFASREVISTSLLLKMMFYSLNERDEGDQINIDLLNQYNTIITEEEKENFVEEFCTKLPNDVVTKYRIEVKNYV